MSKKKVLFLICKTFPFGTGEQYIESELPYLSSAFDQVVIYPNEWYSEPENHGRALPNNVSVLNLNTHLAPLRKTLREYWLAASFALTEALNSQYLRELPRLKYLFDIANHQLHVARNLAQYLEANFKNQLVYFYSYWGHHSCVVLAFLKKKGIIRHFVTRAHSIDLYHYDWALANSLKVPPFQHIKFIYAGRIYTVSKHGSSFLQKKYPRLASKTDCAYLGVKDYGTNKSQAKFFTIATCSNLSSNKRLLELAKAISIVNFPVHWIHFGSGEQEQAIREIAASLPSEKKIELRGQTSNETIRKFLAETPIDVFINLSIVEGLPVSLMEAASSGIPLIATNVYGNPEICRDTISGILLPVNFTMEELIAALSRIQSDTDLKTKLGNGAREVYSTYFNAQKNYTAFCHELLKYPNEIQ